MRKSLLLGALIVGSSIVAAYAQDPPAKGDKAAEPTVLKSNLKDATKCCCRSCTVNFTKELGVPLDYLTQIGHRIHTARRTPDPVELAMASKSLALAEKLSGKKASLTADEVMAEAVELAKLRGISTELAAMIELTGDSKEKTPLQTEMAAAKKREAEAKAAAATGETPKAIHGTLHVVNHSGECLRIYLDGHCVGTVHEGQSGCFYVHACGHHNNLQAICEEGGELVSQQCVHGHYHTYCWHIH
jgi:hypothetical protein